MIQLAFSLLVPAVLLLLSFYLLFSKSVSVDSFLLGARSGIDTSFRLLPTLVLLMVGVSMLSASGFPELIGRLFSPLCQRVGIDAALLPLIFIRPFSGSGSNALLLSVYEQNGVDSRTGFLASVIAGSSETVFYVTAVYFSAVHIKKTRHTLPAALLTMAVTVVLAILVGGWFYDKG
ncbi:MAG: spore maturation protein [Clostridia bacterium]|nr:spore maturation protein [Clostridia bacterium]